MKKRRVFFSILLSVSAIFIMNAELKKDDVVMSRVHRAFGSTSDCGLCHGDNNDIEPARCLKCHTHLEERIRLKRGYHQDKDEGCDACHPEHQGKDVSLIDWDPADFDHGETGFSLTGRHRKIQNCHACHTKSRYASPGRTRSFLLKSRECTHCHRSPHLDMKLKCTSCHGTGSWGVDGW